MFDHLAYVFPQQEVNKETSATTTTTSPSSSSSSCEDSQPVHLNQLLSELLSTQHLKGENQYFCESCNKHQDAEEKISIVSSPQYLILHLLRFQLDSANNRWNKVTQE
jgi:ubiquitin C-terminal hydrolase